MPFSPKTLDFLFENKFNNSKEWFHAHKDAYQQDVMQPLIELTDQLAPAICKIDPQIVVIPKTTKSICRIYRDTRFTKDKSIYRSNMWLIFIRDKKESQLPGFYVDISPNGLEYGVGNYQCEPETMRVYREMILRQEPEFMSALQAYQKQRKFKLYGERYKRSKALDQPEIIRDWLDRKCTGVSHFTDDFDLIFSDRLYRTISRDFLRIKPIYDFYLAVYARLDHNER